MKTSTKAIVLLLGLLCTLNFAWAWSNCVTDPCNDTTPTTNTVYLMPPDIDVGTIYTRWDVRDGCRAIVVCSINGQQAWTRTYRGGGQETIITGMTGIAVKLTVYCEQDPETTTPCPGNCGATVKIGNPVTFQCQ